MRKRPTAAAGSRARSPLTASDNASAKLLSGPVLAVGLALWHYSLADLGIGIRLMPLIPLLSPLADPLSARAGEIARGLLPGIGIAVVGITLVAAGPDTMGAQAIALALCSLITVASGLLTERRNTLTVAVVSSALLATVSIAHGRPLAAVLACLLVAPLGYVTARLRADIHWWRRRAQETEERLRLALAEGQAGLFELDLDTTHIYYSPRFREVLGYDGFTTFPPLPRRLNSPDLVWHEDLATFQSELSDTLEFGSPLCIECRMVHASGRTLWVRMEATLRLRPDGTPRRVVGTIVDIDDRRQSEAATRDLVDAARHTLLPTVTHLQQAHRLLAEGHCGPLPAEARRMVDKASDESDSLAGALADLSRLPFAGPTDSPRAVSLAECVFESIDRARNELPGETRLMVRLLDPEVNVTAQRERLIMTLVHLQLYAAEPHAQPGCLAMRVGRRDDLALVELSRTPSVEEELPVADEDTLSPFRTSSAHTADDLRLSGLRAAVRNLGGSLRAVRPSDDSVHLRIDFPCVDPREPVLGPALPTPPGQVVDRPRQTP